MSELSTTDATLATVFYDEWAAAERRFMRQPRKWDDLLSSERSAFLSGAVAVAAHVTTPTAEDFDAAAGTPPVEPLRFALVEQMGHRATVATIRETTFCGKQMLELTAVKTGAVHLVAPESLYEITWLTESDAKARATGVAWTAVALPAANPNPWGDYGADDYPDHADPDEGKDDGMSAAEREEADDLHGFRLDAADEARDLEREAEADL